MAHSTKAHSASAHLLAVDWGTSWLRGALLDSRGKVVGERSFARGILTVRADHFPTVFEECFGDWMSPGVLCLMSGMVGSRHGWQEAPYCPCPAGFADIASKLVWLQPGRMAIVPGLSYDVSGVPDVMRGEEVQVFGALELLGLKDAQLVLPGTHSKWVRVEAGRITQFSTWMTGEFFSLLRQHSILARMMPAEAASSGVSTHPAEPSAAHLAAFDQGVQQALQGVSLLHTAFSARTLALFDKLPAELLPRYLSGLVIGEEVRAQDLSKLKTGESLVMMGSPLLTPWYQRALAQRGVKVRTVGEAASWHGLHALAKALRLV